ncbi:MAG: bifunctional adenosylcobinamide kinase/adenosylcobinamide-phosphate guanylyltransferase [Pseudomonadota bacterium]
MKKITLVIGGCKSGKSHHALQLAQKRGSRQIFIATCVPFDDELKERVARHKAQRDGAWKTVDVPIDLPQAISDHDGENTVLLVDCLTLWINNLLMVSEDKHTMDEALTNLILALSGARCPVILVANEVGAGIVPENRLARLFRDAAGVANQRIAAVADRVIYMVAGIPMTIKGEKDG